MATSYDGIIIGAGVMGATAALQLGSAGLKRLLLLEKAPGAGFGSTGKSSAIFRQTYSHHETCLMAHESLGIIRDWGQFLGLRETRADFRASGVAFLFPKGDPAVKEVMALHRRVGVKSELLDTKGRAELMADFDFCALPLDLEAEEHECGGELDAIFEHEAGYADPVGTTEDLLEAARALGAEVRFNTTVSTVLQRGGRVTGVEVAGAEIHAPLVINCAGPWAMGLNQAAGAPLSEDIVPIRAQKVAKQFPEKLKGPLPVVNDLINGFNLRPAAGGGQIFLSSFNPKYGGEVVADPDRYDDNADTDFREEHLLQAHHRVPAFRARGRITSYSGIYTVNRDDNHPVIDETELKGLFTACGFSGHGFKLSPVVGMILAQKVLGQWGLGKTAVPLDFFNRGRAPHRSFWGGFFS